MRTEELLAMGVFGRGSRLGERIARLLERGREFSPRVSRTRVAVSAAMLLACGMVGSIVPRWIALAQEPLRFEVVSVKPTPPERLNRLRRDYCPGGGAFSVGGAPVLWSIQYAYRLRD